MSEELPSSEAALKLLFYCGCSKRVIKHCKAVSALAVKFAKTCARKGLVVDVNLVEVGALLHDIGRSKTHDVTHAVVGMEIAKSLHLPQSILSIIECHIGAGIKADEAEKLGLPIKDYFPVTLEEKLVAYADKLIEGSHVVSIERTIEQFSKTLGHGHPAINRITRLHEELCPFTGDYYANNHCS